MATFYAFYHYRRLWQLLATIETELKLHDVGNGCMTMLGHGDLDCWDLETRYAIGWDCTFGEGGDRFLIVSCRMLTDLDLNRLYATRNGDDE